MPAVFICVTVDIFLPYATNLKDKRQIVNSIVEKLRARTVASICQTDYQNFWQKSQLGIAVAGNDKMFVEKELTKIKVILNEYDQIQVADFQIDYL